MANNLNLEEQEQLDALKHFWKQYGNAITWVLIVVLSSFAAWSGYHQWQRSQVAQAAGMYDEVQRVVAAGDVAMAERAFGDMKERFGRTVYAQQAGLLLAKLAVDKSMPEIAKTALTWVAEKSADDGYAAIAKLRLAGLLTDEKSFDAALKLMDVAPAHEFVALFADRRGDVLAIQNKPTEAKIEYLKAYEALDERSDYRGLVEIKLNALGGQVPSVQEGKK